MPILDDLKDAYLRGELPQTPLITRLMDAIGKTIVELSCKRGDRIYLIRDYWSKKENKFVKKVCTTHFISYLIYPDNSARILYNITADSSWHEIDNLYFDLKAARAELERSGNGVSLEEIEYGNDITEDFCDWCEENINHTLCHRRDGQKEELR